MSQPQPYNRQFSFANFQATSPSKPLPGASVDLELNAVLASISAILANMKLIQRDDGAIKNGSIGKDQLSPALQIGFLPPTVWTTFTPYVASPASTVFFENKFYSCLVSHTSGAAFLGDSRWLLEGNCGPVRHHGFLCKQHRDHSARRHPRHRRAVSSLRHRLAHHSKRQSDCRRCAVDTDNGQHHARALAGHSGVAGNELVELFAPTNYSQLSTF